MEFMSVTTTESDTSTDLTAFPPRPLTRSEYYKCLPLTKRIHHCLLQDAKGKSKKKSLKKSLSISSSDSAPSTIQVVSPHQTSASTTSIETKSSSIDEKRTPRTSDTRSRSMTIYDNWRHGEVIHEGDGQDRLSYDAFSRNLSDDGIRVIEWGSTIKPSLRAHMNDPNYDTIAQLDSDIIFKNSRSPLPLRSPLKKQVRGRYVS